MGGGTDTKSGPKTYLLVFAAGVVAGYLVCHFHVCSWIGLCEQTAIHQPGPLDPGPR